MQLNQCLRQLASDANIFPQLQCISCMSVFLNMHDIAFHECSIGTDQEQGFWLLFQQKSTQMLSDNRLFD